MLTLDRYLLKTCIGAIALTLLLFVSLDGLFSFMGELESVGEGRYGVSSALIYVLLTVPRRAHELFSTSALIGTVLAMGQLAQSSELVAMRASGYSRLRIAIAALAATAVLLIPVLLIGETIAPAGEKQAQAQALSARSSDVSLGEKSGLWIRDGSAFINANRTVAQAQGGFRTVDLSDVTIYEFDAERQLSAIVTAKRAVQAGDEWRLTEVSRTQFGDRSVTVNTLDELKRPSSIDPNLLSAGVISPRYLPVRELLDFRRYLSANQLNADAYNQALFARLSYPLTVLATVLAGLPFVFGALRMGGLGKRLFVGILLGVGFYFFNQLASNLAEVYRVSPWIGAFAPALILIAGALVLLKRQR
jgi:lipopolysaccharide export system permease protein